MKNAFCANLIAAFLMSAAVLPGYAEVTDDPEAPICATASTSYTGAPLPHLRLIAQSKLFENHNGQLKECAELGIFDVGAGFLQLGTGVLKKGSENIAYTRVLGKSPRRGWLEGWFPSDLVKSTGSSMVFEVAAQNVAQCDANRLGADFTRAEPVPGGRRFWSMACSGAQDGYEVTHSNGVFDASKSKQYAQDWCRRVGGLPLYTIMSCPAIPASLGAIAKPVGMTRPEAVETYHLWGDCNGDLAAAIQLCETMSGCACASFRQ